MVTPHVDRTAQAPPLHKTRSGWTPRMPLESFDIFPSKQTSPTGKVPVENRRGAQYTVACALNSEALVAKWSRLQ